MKAMLWKHNKRKKAYTMFELLLVVALVTVLGSLYVPIFQSFQYRNELDSTASLLVKAIRNAQTFSFASNGDSQWGVQFQSPTTVLFKGSTYAGRDTTADVNYSIPSTITLSGLTTIVFDKLTGNPTPTSATLTLTSTASTGTTRTITINSKGVVNY